MDQPWTLHLIANTHWDREWYMGFERYRLRLVQLMDRLVTRLQRDDFFKAFLLDGQFIAIQDYLDIRPEREPQIRQLVREGRLNIGPWYTQPLETLVSGEALIRNLMMGIRASRRMGGATMISYTIDQFGHVGQIPQILKGFGIPYSVAWRGVPPGMKSVFIWRGPDGSEVLFFYSNGGYGEATALPRNLEDFTETFEQTGFPRAGLRRRVADLIAHRSPKATTPHLICLNGVDHAFLQEDLPEVVAAINRECAPVRAVQSTLAEYIAEVLRAQERTSVALAEHRGELLDLNEAVLKDVHSFRADLKLANRRVEGALEKWAEPFTAVAWRTGLSPYPAAQINKAWQYVLQNQAHDSIACSSIDKVYRHVMARYDWAEDIAEDICEQSLLVITNAFAPVAPAETDRLPLFVFNPLSWTRHEVLTTTIDVPQALEWTAFRVVGEQGECPSLLQDQGVARHVRYNPLRGHCTVVPVRRWRVTFATGDVPPIGFKRFCLQENTPCAAAGASLLRSPCCMENDILRVTINPNGAFDLVHKPTGASFPGLHYFEDSGEAGDGYFHRPPPDNRICLSAGGQADIAIVRDTPLEAAIEVHQVFEVPAEIERDRMARSPRLAACEIHSILRLTAGGARLDILTTIVNRAKDHRLRVLFPTGLAADEAVAEQPFDEVARPATASGTEVHPQQTYVDVSAGRTGLMIANAGLYEYELMRDADRTLALTLLRCSDRIDNGAFVDPEYLLPEGQCLGEYTFGYSIIAHGADRSAARSQAYEFAFPLKAVVRREVEEAALPGYEPPVLPGPLPSCGSFVEVRPEGVVVSAIKKHEDRDSLVVRLFNTAAQGAEGALRLTIPGWKPSRAWATNLNEEQTAALAVGAEGWVSFQIRPRGLFTMELG